MSLSDQLIVSNQLHQIKFYINHFHENESFEKLAIQSLEQSDLILKKNIRETFVNFSPEIIIEYAETALKLEGQQHLAENYTNLYFQRNFSKGQVYIRALLVKAQLVVLNGQQNLLKGEEMLQVIQNGLNYVRQALNVISTNENKQKYAFLIYNTSQCVYNIVRNMIKFNWVKNFTEFVEKLDKLFDEVDDPDYNWRCRYSWLLFYCLYDQDKKSDAVKVLDKLWENTKKKGPCNFQDQLFRLRIHLSRENSSLLNVCKADADKNEQSGWKLLLTLQMMRSTLIPEAQIEKELINVINSMNSSVLPGNEIGVTSKLTPIIQERLAEAGRIALQHNLINIADNITNFLSKERQLSQKPYIMHEYNKAELYIKKAGPLIDSKTGMRLNSNQIKQQEVERRIDALKILEKVMISNKKILDPDLVYDGAVLIWNIGLPFLNATYKHHVYKAFLSASQLIEQIQSNDHALRVNFHLEIAKIELQDDYLVKAEQHIKKALELDYSIPLSKITTKYEPNEDISIYQRPYEKYLTALYEKIKLKQNIYSQPKDVIERVTLDLESASNSKSENMKIDILQKSLGFLVNLEEKEFYPDPSKNLVKEEIDKLQIKHQQHNLWIYKQKKMLAGEIAKMAFEWEFNDVAMKAIEFVLHDTWSPQNSEEIIQIQVECCYNMAQIKIDSLKQDNYEISYKDPIKIVEDEIQNEQEEDQLSAEKKEDILNQKRSIIEYYLKGLKLADSIQQSWLVFNGAIHVWNNYLATFRNPINDSKLLEEISTLLKEFFETMKNSFKELEKKQIIDYDSNTKIQVNSNIGIIYARLMEGKQQYEEVMRVCEALLQLPLGSHTRKLINSIKARVAQTGKVSATGGAGGNKAADKNKANKKQDANTNQQSTSTEHVLFAVVSQLEVITNSTNSSQQIMSDIVKCYETLETWQAKENDETELELHAELWAKLARLALNIENTQMYKYSLRCVEKSLSLLNNNIQSDLQSIPSSRLRWYSLAEYLYSENLIRMLNPETQETDSQEQLLFHALKHAVEGANKGMKANMNSLVLDAAKMTWNICAKLQDSAVNRKALIKPIFSTLFYLKTCKEKTEPDLILLLSQLLFKGCIENEEFAIGENVCDMVFELIPKQQQKPIWEAKMIFMSQQGKNELQAIQNMKEADASLQSKVQIRLARASNNVYKQCQAYERAIEILKKENSVEIVEVYIEFSEWLLRNEYDSKDVIENLLQAADTLIEIELDLDEDENEDDEDFEERASTIFSRSIQNKNSKISKGTHTVSQIQRSKQGSVTGKTSMKSNKKSEQKDKARINKSNHGGNQSRISRTGMRVTKTIKSKQSKSIFTQREEEPMPEHLNCAHYERLVRIHVMLSMIAQTQEEQLQYALDAKFFLSKIFEVSFRTLNQMAENAASYSNKIDQKLQQKDPKKDDLQQSKTDSHHPKDTQQQQDTEKKDYVKPQYMMPTSLQEWIELQFSKEFLEKVRGSEDYNFMCKFLFEKAEITYKYVDLLIDIFQKIGLHTHNVILLQFQRFFSKEILSNSYLSILQDFRFSRLLNMLGFSKQSSQIITPQSLNKLKLSEQERKQFLAKTESSKVVATAKKINDFTEQYVHVPYLIQEFHPYQIWIQTALELYYIGDLIRSRDLLNEAYKHALILQSKLEMGEIYLYLAMICYLEGDYTESLQYHMKSHKLIKNLHLWELSIRETFKTLLKLNKSEDILAFLKKIIEVFSDVRNNKSQQDKKKQYSIPNKLQIDQLLATTYLLLAKYYLKSLLQEYSEKSLIQGFENIQNALQYMLETGAFMTHYETILNLFFKLNVYSESQNFTSFFQISKGYKMIQKIIQNLELVEKNIIKTLKYSILLEKQSESLKTPLMQIYSRLKIQQASSISLQGQLKQIKRTQFQDQEFTELQETSKEAPFKKEQSIQQPQFLQKYLKKLQNQIDSVLISVPKNLQDYEKSISILKACISKISKENYLYVIACIELTRAQRCQLEKQLIIQKIWTSKAQFDQMQQDLEAETIDESQVLKPLTKQEKDQVTEGIIQSLQFQSDKTNDSENPFHSKYINYYLKKFYQDILEYFGSENPERAFEYLSKFQHYSYSSHVQTYLKKILQGKHKFVLYQRLNAHVKKILFQNTPSTMKNPFEKDEKDDQQAFKLWDKIYKMPNYYDIIKDRLPNNTLYSILKLSDDKRYFYFSYISSLTDKISGKRKITFQCKKKILTAETHNQLQYLIQKVNEIKKMLIKTPVQTEQEFKQKLLKQQQLEFQKVLAQLEDFSSFFTEYLEEVLNKPPPTDSEDQPADANPQPPAKDPKNAKKAGKDAKNAAPQESIVGTTPSGYESCVLLVDMDLFNIPFEALKVFRNVPVLTRDFSLIIQGQRLESIDYNPQTNLSKGLNKENLKYIEYEFKEEEPKEGQQQDEQAKNSLSLKPIIDTFVQQNQAQKFAFQGCTSNDRVTSLGEWNNYLQNGSMLLLYGNPGIMDIITPKLFIDFNEIINTNCILLFDKINAKKSSLRKFSSLESQGEKTPLSDQFLTSSMLLTLSGVQQIGICQWSVEAERYPNIISSLLSELAKNKYVPSTLNSYRESLLEEEKEKEQQEGQEQKEQLSLQKHNCIFIGVPILRVQQ